MRALELSGKRFARLTVIERASKRPDGARWWRCSCECGGHCEVRGSDLLRGSVKSCGCLRIDLPKARATHGGSGSRLYRIWQAMRDRTQNPRASRFSYYGGRGIAVCPQWEDFKVFRDWALSNGYASNLSIDRIDNDGDYEPANCRWATQQQQVQNRRTPAEMRKAR